jgi:hypothetical protein
MEQIATQVESGDQEWKQRGSKSDLFKCVYRAQVCLWIPISLKQHIQFLL